MHPEKSALRRSHFFAPEHGGNAVAGGGHPGDSSVPASEAIDDAFGQNEAGRGQIPGVGVPGSKGFPVGKLRAEISRRAEQIWEEEGRPDGRAEEHWLRAEAEMAQRGA